MGNGTYLSFIMGFAQWLLVVYALFLVRLPFLAWLHFSEFVFVFTPVYAVIAVIVGRIHMTTQALTDSAVSAPASPFEFKMKPWGREKLLGMPSSLTSYEIQDVWLEYLQVFHPNFRTEWVATKRAELSVYIDRTKSLLKGQELR